MDDPGRIGVSQAPGIDEHSAERTDDPASPLATRALLRVGRNAEVPELTRLATISHWEQEILNLLLTRIPMGPVEPRTWSPNRSAASPTGWATSGIIDTAHCSTRVSNGTIVQVHESGDDPAPDRVKPEWLG